MRYVRSWMTRARVSVTSIQRYFYSPSFLLTGGTVFLRSRVGRSNHSVSGFAPRFPVCACAMRLDCLPPPFPAFFSKLMFTFAPALTHIRSKEKGGGEQGSRISRYECCRCLHPGLSVEGLVGGTDTVINIVCSRQGHVSATVYGASTFGCWFGGGSTVASHRTTCDELLVLLNCALSRSFQLYMHEVVCFKL